MISQQSLDEFFRLRIFEPLPMAMNDGPREGVGFGPGFSVRVAHSHKEPHEVVGQYGWRGAASTQFWISPRHELIVIALRQFMPYEDRLTDALKPIVFEALLD